MSTLAIIGFILMAVLMYVLIKEKNGSATSIYSASFNCCNDCGI